MNKKVIIAVVILLAGFLSLVGALALRPGEKGGRRGGIPGQAIGVINIEGLITGGTGTSGFLGAGAGSGEILEQLKEARENPDIRAVVIRINSPGGSAPASQEIGEEVEKLRQAGKKVVASMGDMATSGGYWIAATADKIVANPATMTGSIGVIMELQNLQELYGKIGVKPVVIKSGPHKDMASTSRPLTPEEEKILQGMVDDIYAQFVDVVVKGRKMEREKVKELADGRIFTGRQARELGLVDQLGNYYDAVALAAKLAGIKGEPEIYQLGKKSPWELIFSGAGKIQGFLSPEKALTAEEIQALKRVLGGPWSY